MSLSANTERVPSSKHSSITGIDTSSLSGDYSTLAKNNPYLAYDYEPGIWDRLGNYFGFRTGEDRYREEMALAAKQYDTQLLSVNAENNYNSEEAKAQRMREAGMNPDLLGTGQVSEAAEFNEPETSPAAADNSQAVANFAGNVMSIFTTTMGLVKDIGQLSLLSNQIKAGQYENAGKLFQMAREAFLTSLNDKGWQPTADGSGFEVALTDLRNEGTHLTKTYEDMYGLSHKDRKRFRKMFTELGASVTTHLDAYKMWNQFEKERKGYAMSRASKFYSPVDSDMTEMLSILSKNLDTLNEKSVDLKLSQVDNQQQFEEIIERGTEANAINSENRKAAATATTEQEINDSWQNIVHELSAAANRGNFWAQVSLLVVSFLRATSMPRYHSVQTSSTQPELSGSQQSPYPPGEDFESYWMGMKK